MHTCPHPLHSPTHRRKNTIASFLTNDRLCHVSWGAETVTCVLYFVTVGGGVGSIIFSRPIIKSQYISGLCPSLWVSQVCLHFFSSYVRKSMAGSDRLGKYPSLCEISTCNVLWTIGVCSEKTHELCFKMFALPRASVLTLRVSLVFQR